MVPAKLKPCPFCGDGPLEGVLNIIKGGSRYYFRCYCWKCGAMGPIKKTEDGADTAWNRRVQPDGKTRKRGNT